MNSISFADTSVGYIAGDSGILLKTTDGGLSWIRKLTGITNNLYRVYFPDPLVGCVLDVQNIYKTMDGGETWALDWTDPGSLNSILFTDINTGYAVGVLGTIRKTATFAVVPI